MFVLTVPGRLMRHVDANFTGLNGRQTLSLAAGRVILSERLYEEKLS